MFVIDWYRTFTITSTKLNSSLYELNRTEYNYCLPNQFGKQNPIPEGSNPVANLRPRPSIFRKYSACAPFLSRFMLEQGEKKY